MSIENKLVSKPMTLNEILKIADEDGYFCVNVHLDLDNVIDYIKNQEIHHCKRTFIEEYHDFLEKFEVDFDERYIFKPIKWMYD